MVCWLMQGCNREQPTSRPPQASVPVSAAFSEICGKIPSSIGALQYQRCPMTNGTYSVDCPAPVPSRMLGRIESTH